MILSDEIRDTISDLFDDLGLTAPDQEPAAPGKVTNTFPMYDFVIQDIDQEGAYAYEYEPAPGTKIVEYGEVIADLELCAYNNSMVACESWVNSFMLAAANYFNANNNNGAPHFELSFLRSGYPFSLILSLKEDESIIYGDEDMTGQKNLYITKIPAQIRFKAASVQDSSSDEHFNTFTFVFNGETVATLEA